MLVLIAVASTVYALIALPNEKSKGTAAAQNGPTHSASAPATGSSSTSAASVSPGPSSATPSTQAGARAALLQWLRTALPSGAPIAAPHALVAALHGEGFTAVTPAGSASTAAASTSTSTADASTSGATSGVWLIGSPARVAALAVPVARFGSGTSATSIGLVVAGTAPGRQDDAVRADRENRLTVDAELARNPNVHTDAAVHAELLAGRLDPRATLMLALLATSTPVQVVAMPVDPAEAAVGRPSRTLVVQAPAAKLEALRTQTPPRYWPASSTTTGGRTTLVWNVAVNPVPTVS